MLTPIEQMAESFHAAPDPELPEHVKAAADCEPYQPWAVAHMHIAHNVSFVYLKLEEICSAIGPSVYPAKESLWLCVRILSV